MCNKTSLQNQRGISLILVLFLLVVVSLLAASMARLNRGGSQAVSMEIQSTRALFAAESGAQIAAMRIFPINGGASSCSNTTFTQAFNATGLNGCTATVTCSAPITAAGRTIQTVVSEGQCSIGTNDYARRRITVGLRSL